MNSRPTSILVVLIFVVVGGITIAQGEDSKIPGTRPSHSPSTKPRAAIPPRKRVELAEPVTIANTTLSFCPAKGWKVTELEPGVTYTLLSPSRQSIVVLEVLPEDVKADKDFPENQLAAARAKLNRNPATKIKTPPTREMDARFILRFHSSFTTHDMPGNMIEMYREVGSRVVMARVNAMGGPSTPNPIFVAEDVLLSMQDTSANPTSQPAAEPAK